MPKIYKEIKKFAKQGENSVKIFLINDLSEKDLDYIGSLLEKNGYIFYKVPSINAIEIYWKEKE